MKCAGLMPGKGAAHRSGRTWHVHPRYHARCLPERRYGNLILSFRLRDGWHMGTVNVFPLSGSSYPQRLDRSLNHIESRQDKILHARQS